MAIGIKTFGRIAETENKTTKAIRAVLKEVINDELLNMESLLCKLQPKERLELVIKLTHFVLPKLAPEPIESIQQFEVTILKGNGQPYEDKDDCL